MAEQDPSSPRTRLRRHAERGQHDLSVVTAVIDAAAVTHLGVQTDEGPLVLPMAHGRDEEFLYLHGALRNGVLNAAIGNEVCATITILDALVMARTAFNNSMNYRCAVVRGVAERVEGPDAVRALQIISDHVVPTWDLGRPTTPSEIRRTLVVRLPLAESSAKVRSGDPVDEDEDLDGPWFAGTIALERRWGPVVAAANVRPDVGVPDRFAALEGPIG